jgi:multidrug resistance efflux pump
MSDHNDRTEVYAPPETITPGKDGKVEVGKKNSFTSFRENPILFLRKNPYVLGVSIVLLIAVITTSILYWLDGQSKVYIDNAGIWAPVISIGPVTPGVINGVYVNVGEMVGPRQQLAMVGNQVIISQTSGVITWVQNTPGEVSSSQAPVVKMIDPSTLRLVGHIQEDKGLRYIHPGQKVIFTVDAFGSQQFQGMVESVTPMADNTSVAFSISDKRPENTFDVTTTFDSSANPQLVNGMSARMWVYK